MTEDDYIKATTLAKLRIIECPGIDNYDEVVFRMQRDIVTLEAEMDR